jgi:hypothetical protein
MGLERGGSRGKPPKPPQAAGPRRPAFTRDPHVDISICHGADSAKMVHHVAILGLRVDDAEKSRFPSRPAARTRGSGGLFSPDDASLRTTSSPWTRVVTSLAGQSVPDPSVLLQEGLPTVVVNGGRAQEF